MKVRIFPGTLINSVFKFVLETAQNLYELGSSLSEFVIEEAKTGIYKIYLDRFPVIERLSVHEIMSSYIWGWSEPNKSRKLIRHSTNFYVLELTKISGIIWLNCLCDEGIIHFLQSEFVMLKEQK